MAQSSGKLKLRKTVKSVDSRKVTKGNPMGGILGIIMSGQKKVDVIGRNGYVYVRLRDNQNELIQAFNDKVAQVYDLPVLVEQDENYPNVWRVVDRDIGRYKEWQSSYVPRHANQHAFSGQAGAGGDVVWVYGNQFMPLLTHPSGSAGANNVVVEPFVYYYQGNWKYAGGTGTPDILTYKPTGSNARMVLAYLDSDTNPALVASDEYFSANITGSINILPYLPSLPETAGIPLAGIRLVSGTSKILWSNLYDLRPIITGDGFIPTGAYGHIIQDEGVSLSHRPILNFVGTLVWAQDDSVNNRTNIIVSGSSSGAGHTIQDEGIDLPSRTYLNFKGLGVWAIDNDPDTDIIISGSPQFASLAEAQAGVVESKIVAPNNLPVWVIGGAFVRRDSYSGNARGDAAVDLQRVRSANGQVAAGYSSAILGGERNTITPDAYDSIIGGGYSNSIAAEESFIGGGNGNLIITGAADATIVGGTSNKIDAGGDAGFIGGGSSNYVSGTAATIPGGFQNKASRDYSFAQGRKALAEHVGASIFSDSLAQNFPSLYQDEYAIRARGGFRVNTQIDAADGSVINTGTFSYKDGIGYIGGILGVKTQTPQHEIDVAGIVQAYNFISTIGSGTMPYAATSSTLNTNLNADLLDDMHASAFAGSGHNHVHNSLLGLADGDTHTQYILADGSRPFLTVAQFEDVDVVDPPSQSRGQLWVLAPGGADAEGSLMFTNTNSTGKDYTAVLSPVGSVVLFAGSVSGLPTGWLLCNGAAVSRITYDRLFSVIGVVFGPGDSTGTFNLPDLEGRFPIGAESSTDHDLGEVGGEASSNLQHTHGAGTFVNSNESSHTHSVTVPGEAVGTNPLGPSQTVGQDGAITSGGGSAHNHTITGSSASGGSAAQENRPPYQALHYIIRT